MNSTLFSQIFDNVPQAIWLKDTASIYLAANNAFCEAFSLDRLDLIGKTDFDIWPNRPDLAQKYRTDDALVFKEQKRIEYDEEAIFGDTVVAVHTIKTPLFDDDDNLMGVMGVAWDISEHKQLERILQEEKMNLARSNQDLETFAYITSHDLQEPLRTISNYLQLLSKKYEDKLDEKGQKYINYAVHGAQNMKKLIDNLLEYSRLTSTKTHYKNFNPHRMITNIKGNLASHISESKAHIHIDDLPDQISADPAQIELVLQNLIQNALKYRNKNKTPQIRIKCIENKDSFTFSVKDNGPGIKSDNHDKVFVGFQRFGDKNSIEGAGLGLAICKKIVERHGGKIWVESEINKGATFYFTTKKPNE